MYRSFPIRAESALKRFAFLITAMTRDAGDYGDLLMLLCVPSCPLWLSSLVPHVKAGCRACRHTLARRRRLPHDSPRFVRGIAVIATAYDMHLAQRKAAFNQRNVCVG